MKNEIPGLPDGIGAAELRLRSEYGRQYEVVQWDLYHRKLVPQGAKRVVFFDQNVGSVLNGYTDTDTHLSSQMPGGTAFVTDGLGIMVTGKARSIWQRELAPKGSLEIVLLNKIYRRVPLAIVPVLDDKAALSKTVTRESKVPGRAWKVVTREDTARLYPLNSPRLIIPGTYYYAVNMDFCPLPEITEPVWVGVVLSGWQVRSLQ